MLLALILGNVVQLQNRVEIKCSGCELYPNLWDTLFPGVAISICFSWASVKTNKQTNCLSLIKAVIFIIDKITVEFLSLTGLLMGGGRGSVLVEEGYLVT